MTLRSWRRWGLGYQGVELLGGCLALRSLWRDHLLFLEHMHECNAGHGALAGIALMHMRKKGQRVAEGGAEGLTPAAQFYALAA